MLNLELISDYNMLLMMKDGMRGGICVISNRYCSANNKYMSNYDPSKPSSFIQQLDANNQYGWAMDQPLPLKDHKCMTPEELENWHDIPCFLEVDLKYPTHLHDLHNDYPFCAERIKIGKTVKLVPNLNDKLKYVIHHRNLKQCLDHGLILKKIHPGSCFTESAWLKDYTALNTKFRAAAKSKFEQNLFKEINVVIF
jgi:hypothetical protein